MKESTSWAVGVLLFISAVLLFGLLSGCPRDPPLTDPLPCPASAPPCSQSPPDGGVQACSPSACYCPPGAGVCCCEDAPPTPRKCPESASYRPIYLSDPIKVSKGNCPKSPINTDHVLGGKEMTSGPFKSPNGTCYVLVQQNCMYCNSTITISKDIVTCPPKGC